MSTHPKEIRWQQSFFNLKNALIALEKGVGIKNPSDIEKAGIIQFYEIAFELAWKTIKDYLEAGGYLVKSPREALKQAYQIELISEGEIWLDALDDRNLTAHIYDEQTADKIVVRIKEVYFPILIKLSKKLDNELND